MCFQSSVQKNTMPDRTDGDRQGKAQCAPSHEVRSDADHKAESPSGNRDQHSGSVSGMQRYWKDIIKCRDRRGHRKKTVLLRDGKRHEEPDPQGQPDTGGLSHKRIVLIDPQQMEEEVQM